MLAQSVAQQYHMAGVRTEESKPEFEGLSRTLLTLLLPLMQRADPGRLRTGLSVCVTVDRWYGGGRSGDGGWTV